jgi:hypothetical protein
VIKNFSQGRSIASRLRIAAAFGAVVASFGILIAREAVAAPVPTMSAASDATGAARASTAAEGAAGKAEAETLVLENFPSYVETVEAIRHLTFKGPVAKGRQSVEEFRAFIAGEIDRDLPAGRAGCTSRSLARLGMIPEAIDLRKAYGDILLSQVAAYYNPERKTFYVVRSDLPPEAMRPTVVHDDARLNQPGSSMGGCASRQTRRETPPVPRQEAPTWRSRCAFSSPRKKSRPGRRGDH